MEENVNHPNHYNSDKYECIDVMVDVLGVEAVKNFSHCNAFKYIWRANRKNGIEDLKKAKRYIEIYIELEEEHGCKQLSVGDAENSKRLRFALSTAFKRMFGSLW